MTGCDFLSEPEPPADPPTENAPSPGWTGPSVPKSSHVVFDIETGPAWLSNKIEDAKEFCQPLGIDYDPDSIGPHPGEFDASTVKTGNLKDAEKIRAKVALERDKFAAKIEEYDRKKETGHDLFWLGVIDKAALSPVTGKILAIGYLQDGKVEIADKTRDHEGVEEQFLLSGFFDWFECASSKPREQLSMLAYNGDGFDLPMIFWRAAILGLEIPRGFKTKDGRFFSPTFIDLMKFWPPNLRDPWKGKNGPPTAKHAANIFGCKRPDDEIEGKDFWRYWIGSQEEKAKAIGYLENDCREEGIIARALGVI